MLDFLQAIHAAEERQAELDARVFAEEKRVLKVWIITKHNLQFCNFIYGLPDWCNELCFNLSFCTFQEKYERNLKDAAARELMRAEEAAMLDKVIKISSLLLLSFSLNINLLVVAV